MTTNEKVARRKLSLLELAKELNNVSKACKLIGWLITSCRSANNIMPITIFLPAGTASFFYSA